MLNVSPLQLRVSRGDRAGLAHQRRLETRRPSGENNRRRTRRCPAQCASLGARMCTLLCEKLDGLGGAEIEVYDGAGCGHPEGDIRLRAERWV